MPQRRRAVCSTSLVFLASVACDSPVTNDDFGTAGYARFSGTASRANGAPYGNAPMSWGCGPDSVIEFGSTFSSRADGTFDVDVRVPGPYSLPADRRFMCRVGISLPDPPSPLTAVTTRALFNASAATRPTTTFAVREGVVIDSTTQ